MISPLSLYQSIFTSFFLSVIGYSLTLLSVIVTARVLSGEDYGILGLSLGALNLFVLTLTSGSSNFLAKVFARVERHGLLNHLLFYSSLLTILICIIGAFFCFINYYWPSYIGDIYNHYFLIIILGAILLAIKNHLQRIFLAKYFIKLSCLLDILDPLIRIVLIIGIFIIGISSAETVLIAYIISTASVVIIALVLIRIKLSFNRKPIIPNSKRKLLWLKKAFLIYFKRFFVLGLVGWGMTIGPRFIIGFSADIESVGIYFYAAQIMYLPFVFLSATVMKVLAPRIFNNLDIYNEMLTSISAIKKLQIVQSGLLIIAFTLVPYFGKLIWLLGGIEAPEYSNSVLRLLCLAGILTGMNQYLISLALKVNKFDNVVLFQVIVLIILSFGVLIDKSYVILFCSTMVLLNSVITNIILYFQLLKI